MALDNMGYQGVMKLAKDPNVFSNYGWRKIDWLKITRACYDEAVRLKGESFPGSAVAYKAGWFPGLNKLRRYGIVERDDKLSNERETWWIMPDLNGVARALHELGYL